MQDKIIDWFEIPTIDFERAINFYNTIFSIQLERGEVKDYQMAFFPRAMPSGALVKNKINDDQTYQISDKGPILFLNGGDDLNDVLNKIEVAGGKVLKPKTFIEDDIGYYAIFIDSEGNRIGLHSSK